MLSLKKLNDDQDLAIREHVVDNEDDFTWLDSTDGVGQFEDELFCDVTFSDQHGNVHVVIEDCVVMVDAVKVEEILKAAGLSAVK